MPELPEVETTLRGLEPYLKNAIISDIVVRNASLRWPVPVKQLSTLVGQTITGAERRAKYIFIHTKLGSILLHLGMSGSIRVLEIGQRWAGTITWILV
jgi:formamidopyrimidine-DNA glycosylase